MRSYFLLVIFLSAFVVVSCRKDPNIYVKEVRAGVYDSTFHHVQFSTPLELDVQWDSQNLYGFGSDSIDIDANGELDMLIELNLLNEDSLHLLTTTYPEPFPNLRLKTRSNFQVSMTDEYTYTGLGSGIHSIFIARHLYGQRLDTISSWANSPSYGSAIYQENPTSYIPYGDWYYSDTINYIGFRLDGYRIGWVEVDLTDAKNPKFCSYAISL